MLHKHSLLKIAGTGDAISGAGDDANKATEQFKNFADTIAALSDSPETKALNTAWQEIDDNQKVSAETLATLIDLYPEFTKYIDLQTGAILLTKKAIEDKFNLEKQVQIDTLKNLKDELTARLALATAIKTQIQMQYLGSRQGMMLDKLGGKIDTGSLKTEIAALDAQIALLDKVSLDTSTSKDKSSSSKTDDPWKEAADAELATLKYKQSMGLISESEYYSSLLAINNKYFKKS